MVSIVLILFTLIAIIFGAFLISISLSLLLSFPKDRTGKIKLFGLFSITKPSSLSTEIQIKDWTTITIPAPSILFLLIGLGLFTLPFFTTIKYYSEIAQHQEQEATIEKIDRITNDLKRTKEDIYRHLDQVYVQELQYSLNRQDPYVFSFYSDKKNKVYLELDTWCLFSDAKFKVVIDGEPFKLKSEYPDGILPLANLHRRNNISEYLRHRIRDGNYYHEIKFELTTRLSDLAQQQGLSLDKDRVVAIIKSYLVVHKQNNIEN